MFIVSASSSTSSHASLAEGDRLACQPNPDALSGPHAKRPQDRTDNTVRITRLARPWVDDRLRWAKRRGVAGHGWPIVRAKPWRDASDLMRPDVCCVPEMDIAVESRRARVCTLHQGRLNKERLFSARLPTHPPHPSDQSVNQLALHALACGMQPSFHADKAPAHRHYR
jgi:hypothetical protein